MRSSQMISLEVSWYHISTLVIFILIVLCPPHHWRRNQKAPLISSSWKTSITDEELIIDSISKPTLPHGWWTDEEQFKHEKRAIFSTQWLYVSQATRFHQPGDYRTFEIAGFSILLVLGKDQQIRAFHNVCRHRAYAVAKKDCGSSIVLGCKYHGWSYDTKGKLIKAPEFDKIPGFDKTANGLWEIKSVTREGSVFVNLDAGEVPVLAPIPGLRRTKGMSFAREWKVVGSFNWKLLAELALPLSEQKNHAWKALLSIVLVSNNNFLVASNTILQRVDSTTNCCVYTKLQPESITEDKLQSIQTKIQAEIESMEMQQGRLQLGEVPNHETEQFEKLLAAHREKEQEAGQEINPAAQK